MNKSFSLRRQLLIWLLIPILLLWGLGAVMAYITALRFTNLANDRSLFDTTLALAGQIKRVDDKITVDLPRAALNMLEMDPYDKVYYSVRGSNEELISGQEGLPSFPAESEIISKQPIYYDGIFRGQRIRVASLYTSVGDNSGGLIHVQVAETLEKRKTLANEIVINLAVPQLLMIALAGILVWYGIGRGLDPLRPLQEEIESRSHLDLSPIGEEDAPREVKPLIHAINDLLQRLGRTLAAQQRFIADAAHQLRTPLAGLKTQAELALRQTGKEEVHRALKYLLGNSERTIHLVNQLLVLARAEPGKARALAFSRVDVNELAREVSKDWIHHALSKNIDLGFEGADESVFVRGESVLLKEMLGNLIDNAIRYTQAGGRVTVGVRGSQDKGVLSVEDNGPGISVEDRERVFERFYRILGTATDGCGLGLAIVREIAGTHGAEVDLVNRDGTPGTLVEVRFSREK